MASGVDAAQLRDIEPAVTQDAGGEGISPGLLDRAPPRRENALRRPRLRRKQVTACALAPTLAAAAGMSPVRSR
jgi:hypothetical protein